MAATPQPIRARRIRELEIVQATRALFDARGMQDAPIEEIAKAVGIARGLIYRHFASKEELFVLTVTDYLAELAQVQEAAAAPGGDPAARLARSAEAYARFCERYPAFLDCALSLMRRPAGALRDTVSESVWLRLGQGIASCVDHVIEILREGSEAGAFQVEDPDFMANVLWTQTLGVMHLARIRGGVRQAAPGIPEMFPVSPEQVVMTCVSMTLAIVGARA